MLCTETNELRYILQNTLYFRESTSDWISDCCVQRDRRVHMQQLALGTVTIEYRYIGMATVGYSENQDQENVGVGYSGNRVQM